MALLMAVTPLRRQYLQIKRQFPDVIVLFRLGDFYETFDDDAKLTASAMGITLTSREMGKGQRVPMAGIPFHALDSYLPRFVRAGHRVAICEQTSDPAQAEGLVDRDVVRVVTPGTVVEPNLLEQKSNNYLAAVVYGDGQAGLAHVDVTTSHFSVTQLPVDEVALELGRLAPAEILLPEGEAPGVPTGVPTSTLDDAAFDLEMARERLLRHFGVRTLEAYGCDGLPLAIQAAGAVVGYLEETRKAALQQVTDLSTYSTASYMTLDAQTRRNLELTVGGRWGESRQSLLSVVDGTKTPMGGRLLRRWLSQPLLDRQALESRLDAVQWFYDLPIHRAKAIALAGRGGDLERLVNRVSSGVAGPKEVVSLKRTLELIPELVEVLEEGREGSLAEVLGELKPCRETVDLIGSAIADDPPAAVSDGGAIRSGFNEELDRLRESSRDARSFLAGLEQRERERTGIKSLKVGYNRVFGYYIEASKTNLGHIPEDYVRKQTLVGGERFVTPELKEYESLILNAQESIQELEGSLFRQVCRQIGGETRSILSTASGLARIDVYSSLAEVAVRHHYTRPILTEGDEIAIVGGRHPSVERSIEMGTFVPNDTNLSNGEEQVVVLTGPNMAGKSTYLRQVGLIVLLAQVGSFVPAESARLGIVDRVFTRVGLQDDLAAGQSTFMVEMVETALILQNATSRSLIILDEIGRGTSTYDGLSIARAVVEYMHNHPRLGAKTLFATHYHELTEMAKYLPRVRNYHVAVVENEGKVAFLHAIRPGAADRSYGVYVAELAGMPKAVVSRAQEILSDLEVQGTNGRRGRRGRASPPPSPQLPLMSERPPALDELLNLDVASLTPLEAITKLFELQDQAKGGADGSAT